MLATKNNLDPGSMRFAIKSVRPEVWLFWILAFSAILRFVTFTGIVGADDVSIAENALRVVEEGPYLPLGHYAARVGLIYPLAAIFAVAGVGEWQMVVIPFAASLLGVFLAYFIASRVLNQRAGLIAAALVAFFPLDVANASVLMPDLVLGVALATSFALALKVPSARQPYVWAVLAGLVWGYAWLIKVEAFFMAFVYAGFLWQQKANWRPIFVIFAGAAVVVFIENFVYWAAGGEFLHRLHAALDQGGGKFVEEFSETSLWVFPKAWFVTFYQFGLHYYGLAFGLIWIALRRTPGTLAIWLWVVVFLLWLQFGGNPFSETYTVKSHLLRYCTMVTVPMAVVIAAFLNDFWLRGNTLFAKFFIAMLIIMGAFFINFNTLSYERELATKRALDIAVERNFFPLYLDRTSEALAAFYLTEDAHKKQLTPLQVHDFRTQETKVLDVTDDQGYLLLNRGFMEYAWNRYRVDQVALDKFDNLEEVATIDNPGNWLAYLQVRMLIKFADMIPVPGLRNKIAETGNGILRDRDVVLLGPAGGQ